MRGRRGRHLLHVPGVLIFVPIFTGAALWILGTQVSWPVGAGAATVAAGIALATRPRTRAGATGSVAPPVAPDTLPP